MWKIDTVNKKDANNAVFVLILVLINKYKVKIEPTLKINGKVLNHSIVFGTNDCHNLETKAKNGGFKKTKNISQYMYF